MSYSSARDTLRYQLRARPLTTARDISSIPLTSVAKACGKYKSTHKADARPETEALWFYMMNHAVAEVINRVDLDEPLGEYLPIIELYHREIAPRAARLFSYLLMICTREARHMPTLNASFKSTFDPALVEFFGTIKSHGEGGVLKRLLTTPPDTTIGAYTEALRHVFYKHSWHGGAYGGPKWGAVTDCVHETVMGNYSPEMMLDTGWTLQHNGGPIFNKSMLYTSFSAPTIARILDVQRAGMIPQMVGTEDGFSNLATLDLFTAWKQCSGILGDCFTGYVDWFAVEELGAMHKYPAKKKAQIEKYGVPEKHAEMLATMASKTAKAEADAQAEASAEWFIVDPNTKAQKITRAELKEAA